MKVVQHIFLDVLKVMPQQRNFERIVEILVRLCGNGIVEVQIISLEVLKVTPQEQKIEHIFLRR